MSQPTAEAPLRGRPRDPSKREALLAAARGLFLDKGFDAVSMDEVLLAAGVSRVTLYSNFPNKAALLEAVIRRESERIVSDGWLRESLSDELEEALTGFGESLLRFLLDPEMIALERLVFGAARSFPHLGTRIFAAGPGRAHTLLADLIRAAQAENALRSADADLAAADLMGLWQGSCRMEMIFNQRPSPGPAELRKRAAHGVSQFLRLYAPPGRRSHLQDGTV